MVAGEATGPDASDDQQQDIAYIKQRTEGRQILEEYVGGHCLVSLPVALKGHN